MIDELKLGSNQDVMTIEDEENLTKSFFLIRRWLKLPKDLTPMTQDTSLPAEWKVGDTVQLPKDRKYQHCLFKLKSNQEARDMELTEAYDLPDSAILLQLIIMVDQTWLCLFKADFANINQI